MNHVEQSLLWFGGAVLATAALAWIAFQVQQEQIAPVVLFPLAAGVVLALFLLSIRRLLDWPPRLVAVVTAASCAVLLVMGQDYLGHRSRSRHFDDQLAEAHPLAAAALPAEAGVRPDFVQYLTSRWKAHPVAWPVELVLTVAAATGVTIWATRPSTEGGDSGHRESCC